MSEITAGYRVTGRVQGVGFRFWTLRQALKLGLAGTVRNTPDGAVEVRARGPEEKIRQLADLLAAGPPGSHVAGVEPLDPAESALPFPFEITR